MTEWLVFIRKWTGRIVSLPPIFGHLAEDFPVGSLDNVPDAKLLSALETWAGEWVEEHFGDVANWQAKRAREELAIRVKQARRRPGCRVPTEASLLAGIEDRDSGMPLLDLVYEETEAIRHRPVSLIGQMTDHTLRKAGGSNGVPFVHDQEFLLSCETSEDAEFVARRLNREGHGGEEGVVARYGFTVDSDLTGDERVDAQEQVQQASDRASALARRANEILALRSPERAGGNEGNNADFLDSIVGQGDTRLRRIAIVRVLFDLGPVERKKAVAIANDSRCECFFADPTAFKNRAATVRRDCDKMKPYVEGDKGKGGFRLIESARELLARSSEIQFAQRNEHGRKHGRKHDDRV